MGPLNWFSMNPPTPPTIYDTNSNFGAGVMDSYPPYTDVAHAEPLTTASGRALETYEPPLSIEDPFLACNAQFQFQTTFADLKANQAPVHTLPPQSQWWRDHDPSFSPPAAVTAGSTPGISATATSTYREDDGRLSAFDHHATYPPQSAALPLGRSSALPQPQGPDLPLEYSPFNYDLDTWPGGQSDRKVTPEQQWSSPLSAEQIGFPQRPLVHRSKTRPDSALRGVRKPAEKRPTSTPGRNRHRRGAQPAHPEGTTRTFICSFAWYGCESIFVSKNEWKRHVLSQHLQLGFYRCDVGNATTIPGRARRTHLHHPGNPMTLTAKISSPSTNAGYTRLGSSQDAEEHLPRMSRQPSRLGSSSQCVFCQEVFSGEGSWDARMEHVGRHVERDDPQTLSHANEDVLLREWGLREGILQLVDGQFRLASLGGIGR
ncbi:hypothetical protein N7470_001824 [Penicillium chermesinum]|nr:hypothetical protein N7470_001824 [Penicillium chermesinum]